MTDSFRPTNLRGKAWAVLTGKWGNAALAALVYMAVAGAIGAIPFLGYAAVLFVLPLLMMGLYFLFLDVSNGANPDIKTLFEPFNDYLRYLVGGLLVYLYTFLWSLLLVVPGIIKGISYSQTYFLMRENPELTGEQAIQLSMKMMDGHKMDYFLLQLSFIGWMLLGMISFGIGMLWVLPYMATAYAEFYKELKKEWEVKAAFPPNPAAA